MSKRNSPEDPEPDEEPKRAAADPVQEAAPVAVIAAGAAPVAVIAAEADPVAVALGLVPRRPFVLRPVAESDGESDVEQELVPLLAARRVAEAEPVAEAEAESGPTTRREATRARNARAAAAAAVVVDLTTPNTTMDFEVDDTLQVVGVHQTLPRELPARDVLELPADTDEEADGTDEEADGTDVEADVPVPPHGTEGQYAGLYHGSPTYSPVSPAYQHGDEEHDDDVYVPSSAYVMPEPPEPMPDADFAPLEHFAPPPMPAPEDSDEDSDEDFAPPPMPAPEDSDEDFVEDEDGNSGVLGPGDESE
jgi:hypothetical protein